LSDGLSSGAVQSRLDADALGRRLETLHRSLQTDDTDSELELYHRAALTLRVTILGDGKSIETTRGYDEGCAVRLTSHRGRRAAFAATSGSKATSLRWAVARCREGLTPAVQREHWSHGDGAAVSDREGEHHLPAVEELTGWLERARETLAADGFPRLDPLELSIAVAATVESWVAEGGLRASRARTRGWALMRTREAWAGDRASKPVMVARRRWAELPPGAWRMALEDRRLPKQGDVPPPATGVPVLFSPECSALLVRALARALHAAGREPGFEVGPAWKVYDDPRGPDALFGGSFDDAGFTTRRKRLANGNRSCGCIEGRGHYRRPSFRDRPSPSPCHLRVSPTPGAAPADGIVVTALELSPVAPDRWVLGLEGAILEGGRPAGVLRPSFVSIAPEDLVCRCVATVGPPRPSHLGIETPALLFTPLLLHP
jgi:hypothetical protein